ncbi:zinc finger BED domain-containing protein 5-like [Protopterus annectens]|uniref:zinc finger BED domain-containing protein 5-like n=1 Tax=Protopterus annectens TaxID=7888 RepID=UPI001CFA6F8D|nr:zinc finger BED domain-containing protein 5-like [Protopterus annectens]
MASISKCQVDCTSEDDSSDCNESTSKSCMIADQPKAKALDVKKTRLYSDNYVNYGFTFVEKQSMQQPRCIICHKLLSYEAMVPSKLQHHLKTKHPAAAKRDQLYFKCLLQSQQKQVQFFTKAFIVSDRAQLASFQVAELVAKNMKPHTVVESLIMPACRLMVKTMLSDEAEKVIAKIPSSNNTVARRIEMSDISVCNQLKICKRFSLQLDESTDISGKAQLMAFVRYPNQQSLIEQFLFCRELIQTHGEDIFKYVCTFFEQHGLLWQWCTSICTDGAPSMTGCISGFLSLTKATNPNITTTHCFIHREALISKTLPSDLPTVLREVVQIVNCIKLHPAKSQLFSKLCKDMSSDYITILLHNIRWPSRGKVFVRVYKHHLELKTCLQNQPHNEFATLLSDSSWTSKVSYLVDIFEVLNSVNLGMQGVDANILSVTDKLEEFKRKIDLWQQEIETATSIHMFPNAARADLRGVALHDLFLEHLALLKQQLQHYFPSLDTSDKDWVRNPFHQHKNLAGLSLMEKEQLIDVETDRSLQLKFNSVNLAQFWLEVEVEHPDIGAKAIEVLLPFCTTYLCEKAFSAMTSMKSKHRERL